MTDAAAANPDAGAPRNECGRDALNRLVDRTRHAVSGARLSVEKCPDATMGRAAKGAAVLGGALAAGGYLARRSPVFALAFGIGGALLGALGSRYHVSFDWDPDRAFGGNKSDVR
jgi:hypothetical protein